MLVGIRTGGLYCFPMRYRIYNLSKKLLHRSHDSRPICARHSTTASQLEVIDSTATSIRATLPDSPTYAISNSICSQSTENIINRNHATHIMLMNCVLFLLNISDALRIRALALLSIASRKGCIGGMRGGCACISCVCDCFATMSGRWALAGLPAECAKPPT